MKRARCPTTVGSAFTRDCPMYPLKVKEDKWLLCIEAKVVSSCTDCDRKELSYYIKQECNGGALSCKISHGPKEQCSDADWKKYCPGGIDQ